MQDSCILLTRLMRPAWPARHARHVAGRRRDREEREREVAEAEQREALKNMTEAERRAWEAAHPKELAEAPKKKWRFLQKYWHKGAFFQARASGRALLLYLRVKKVYSTAMFRISRFRRALRFQAQKESAWRVSESVSVLDPLEGKLWYATMGCTWAVRQLS